MAITRQKEFSIFLAGDTLIKRSFMNDNDPAFLSLLDLMRSADTTVVHLETLFHTFKGHPQADSGGIYAATIPTIAHELKEAGVDMVSTAHNHSFDYGSLGIIENIESLAEARIANAGTGKNLDEARAAAFVNGNNAVVALVSATATFQAYAAASASLPMIPGRPGVNPLRIITDDAWTVPGIAIDMANWAAKRLGRPVKRFGKQRFRIKGLEIWRGRGFKRVRETYPSPRDETNFLEAVRSASGLADVVIAAVHAHHQKPWLRGFARRCIDAGAAFVVAHGPHEIRGIEFYKNRPIFFCLGDFFFEAPHITKLPAEYYERHGIEHLINEGTPKDAVLSVYKKWGYLRDDKIWQGLVAILDFNAEKLNTIRLIPVDLGTEDPITERGRPRIASPEQGRIIIDEVSRVSAEYGTDIVYDADRNMGIINVSNTWGHGIVKAA